MVARKYLVKIKPHKYNHDGLHFSRHAVVLNDENLSKKRTTTKVLFKDDCSHLHISEEKENSIRNKNTGCFTFTYNVKQLKISISQFPSHFGSILSTILQNFLTNEGNA